MEKILNIYTYDTESGTSKSFPNDDAQIEIIDFSFSASRTGIPSLSATVKYKECLDDKWSYREYIEFKGEKYWVSQIPSSSKDNTDHRYKHSISFLSERAVLGHTYFFDTVESISTDPNSPNKYCSHSSSVLFYGTINEFISRLNASLNLSGLGTTDGGLGYNVVLDSTSIETEKLEASKEFSCENVFITDALSQAFDTWDIPYYFVGKTCHFGYYSVDLTSKPLEYGRDNELVKIERNNANTKVITRATGLGSEDNIPYYYPNDSEKGNYDIYIDGEKIDKDKDIEITDTNLVANSLVDGETYTYSDIKTTPTGDMTQIMVKTYNQTNNDWYSVLNDENIPVENVPASNGHDFKVYFFVNGSDDVQLSFTGVSDDASVKFHLEDFQSIKLYKVTTNDENNVSTESLVQTWTGLSGSNFTTNSDKTLSGTYYFYLSNLDVNKSYPLNDVDSYEYSVDFSVNNVTLADEVESIFRWIPSDTQNEKIKTLRSIGIVYDEKGEGDLGKTIKLVITTEVPTPYQDHLMPSIFSRAEAFPDDNGIPKVTASKIGVERYYNAINGLYDDVTYKNEYKGYNRSENIYTYDDIKPSIIHVVNSDGEPIAEIIDVAYDDDDSDATYGEEYGENANSYIHPYFYVKLRKTDGDYGFNLFDYGLADEEMTFQIVSGNLNGCKFKVQVVETSTNVFKNPVQVYTQYDVDNSEDGSITEDMIGQIVAGGRDKKIKQSNFISSQQDTRTNEVWVALLKDQDTFGIIMPNRANNYLMDTVNDINEFNITGINLPKAYIIAAERELDKAIVEDMQGDNEETFNYSIELSRIFVKEDYDKQSNKENSWYSLLNESAKLKIIYNGKEIEQYISSYSYECKGAELLPKINIELASYVTNVETLAENITAAATKSLNRSATIIAQTTVNKNNIATKKTINTKAAKATTIGGYGIEDAFIDTDGTIVLGNASVKPLTASDKTTTIDWSNITNKPNIPDYFEEDENGDIKVKDKDDGTTRGLWSPSFISSKGIDDTASGGSIDIVRMWEELAAKSSGDESYSTIIDESHIPDTIARVSDLSDYATKEDLAAYGLEWKSLE